MLPWGIVTSTVAITLWSIGLGLSTYPLYGWALPDRAVELGSYRITGIGLVVAFAVTFVVGLSFLLVTPQAIHAMAEGDRRLVRLLLSPDPNAVLEQRVTQLEESRDASVESAAGELRRIERDLHDGAHSDSSAWR